MKSCNQCGKCCIRYGNGQLSASADEIARWAAEYPEIDRYVSNGQIWIDPLNKMPLTRCPWLEADERGRYLCKIYEVRPDDCRYYPTHIDEMIADECEMLEPNDFISKKSAQRKLDIIMSDSRPAFQKS